MATSTTTPPLYAWISGADKAGLHVVVHAIGDRANHTLLDIYERVAREDGPRDRRFRIEHAQHLRPDDLPRFAYAQFAETCKGRLASGYLADVVMLDQDVFTLPRNVFGRRRWC